MEPGGQPYYQQGKKNTGGDGGQGTGCPIPAWKHQKPKGTPGGTYSNTMKQNNNIMYYSFVYNIDHKGWYCHPSNRKKKHILNISQQEAHIIAVAQRKVQHKTLPNSSVDGKRWILAQQRQKANWVM